jgi:methylase of polypeptide subunit release factors
MIDTLDQLHVRATRHSSGNACVYVSLEVTMRKHNPIPRRSFAVLVLFTSLAVAQTTQPKHEPDVPYVPTTEEAVKAMLKLADVKSSDIVYDLGCGDGRIVIAAAKEYGARGVGIDINPVRIAEAKENARKAGVENLVRESGAV